jgi:hypothetical protein
MSKISDTHAALGGGDLSRRPYLNLCLRQFGLHVTKKLPCQLGAVAMVFFDIE